MNLHEFYPEIEPKNPFEKPKFFLEFNSWDGKRWTYKVCQRAILISEEECQKALEERGDDAFLLIEAEGHPYTLWEGELNENKDAISLDTKSFLIYLVDALNEKVINDDVQKISAAWEKQRKCKI